MRSRVLTFFAPQEFDTPLGLYMQGGIFRGMCDRSGIRVEDIRGAKASLDSFVEAEAGKGKETAAVEDVEEKKP